MSETLIKAPVAIIDEDDSPLSKRIAAAFFLPHFNPPAMISLAVIDRGMDAGDYTFVLDIPPNFQRDVLDGKSPAVQYRKSQVEPVELVMRARFNPNLDQIWFGGLMEIINNVTMPSIILTEAALIRERDHGTIEHLLVKASYAD